jgi:type IV secretory pathway VirB9-like protein
MMRLTPFPPILGVLMVVAIGQVRAQTSVPNVPIPAPHSTVSANGVGNTAQFPVQRTAAQPVPPQFLNSTETAIDQQARGQFPTMDRNPSLPLGTLQRSWDRPTPANGQVAPGVVHYMWHPDFVMAVRTRDFMVTTVILPSWERANEFYVGDPVVFETKKIRPNVVAIRSRNAGADSNLTILGASSNVYNFYIRSETWNSMQVTDLTVYVDAPPAEDGGEGASGWSSTPYSNLKLPDYLRGVVLKPENLKFDLAMFVNDEDSKEIAPERVYEDGIFTYFDFGSKAESIKRPVVHQVIDGVDTVVNTRASGENGKIIIAEAVGDFTLRNGSRVVCVKRIEEGQQDTSKAGATVLPRNPPTGG